MLLLGFGPLAATLEASDDARLPACCRRLGAHHCAMPDALIAWMARGVESRTPIVTAPGHCPLYPSAALAALGSPQALPPAHLNALLQDQQKLSAALDSTALQVGQIQTRSARGPPACLFS
jgi:hypothetical protein